MAEAHVVDRATVRGEVLSEKQAIEWEVCKFGTLDLKRGEKLTCPPLRCHGHSWSLWIYPRGDTQSESDSEWISVFLIHHSEEHDMQKLKIKYSLRLGQQENEAVATFEKSHNKWGCMNFVRRDAVLDSSSHHLSDGNLMVKVTIQIYLDKPKPWSPAKTLNKDMLRLLESGDQADITFVVGGTKFHAHRNILTVRAPVLAELVEDTPRDKEVYIDNVDKSSFQALLHFVYAEEAPSSKELKRKAQEFLEVADRFGSTGLKLLAESAIVDSGIDVNNAVDLLFLADAHSCALLKESAMNAIAANPTAVMTSPGWVKVKESASLMAEILEAFTKKPWFANDANLEKMNVATLRRKLDEAGMNPDGTREMLVMHLKTHCSPK